MSAAPKLVLYGYWRSSASYRVRIGLALKGLSYGTSPVHLLRGGGEQLGEAYREKNPMGQVPTLEVIEEGRAPLRLAQSLAILEYLDERFPEPPLLPASAEERATARQLAETVNAGIQPLQNLSVLRHLKNLGVDERAFARRWNEAGLAALEALASRTAGAFLVGDAVSMADCCLVPQLYAARRFGVDPAAYPTLARVEAACLALPAFRAAEPDAQPDAEP